MTGKTVSPHFVKQVGFIIWVALVAVSFVQATPPSPRIPFPVGETLTYQMHWGLFPVGTTQISTQWATLNGRRVLAIHFTAKSSRLVETIYPVRDLLISYIDPETFLPLRLVKKTSEGRLVCDDLLEFDREHKTARWTDYVKKKTFEYPIDDDTQDVISFMYSMRTTPLKAGEERHINIAADDKVQHFRIQAIRDETVNLSCLGKLPSTLLKVSVANKNFFVRKIPGNIWVSKNEHHVVTRLYVKVPVGNVKVSLVSVKEPAVEMTATSK